MPEIKKNIRWRLLSKGRCLEVGTIAADSDREALREILNGAHSVELSPDTNYTLEAGNESASSFGDEFERMARAIGKDTDAPMGGSGYAHDEENFNVHTSKTTRAIRPVRPNDRPDPDMKPRHATRYNMPAPRKPKMEHQTLKQHCVVMDATVVDRLRGGIQEAKFLASQELRIPPRFIFVEKDPRTHSYRFIDKS